ncbi:hypothetical protein CC1G_01079 [Coprinopsis cinerea okayama7|uniref:Nudix hydrolase domain-containing protein n=1 Tax=Coprinopsis cinerea (strain Okayama-7 / 130 / ATCC MYA-4618 / FGSC 9003) TaxID=240176 RepID=A8NEG1_COPC7|nr:hypothetical protein CC1G_01079 [Coprinopsis cinerea okayama7\|eukprot:XP_001833017.1 hypothetical protein CC1G_01079 [Coprinopsis cinerea okayama7\
MRGVTASPYNLPLTITIVGQARAVCQMNYEVSGSAKESSNSGEASECAPKANSSIKNLKPSPTSPRVPTTIFSSESFVLAAGSVLFRTHPITHALQVCLIYHTKRKTYILPKGRKDQNESMEVTAIRETYEETGYPCRLFSCTMPTRAPPPGQNLHPSKVLMADNLVEPFAVEVRQLKCGSLKNVWWFLSWVTENDVERVVGTHASSAEEAYESAFYDVAEALEIMRGSNHFAPILEKAVALVQATLDSKVVQSE